MTFCNIELDLSTSKLKEALQRSATLNVGYNVYIYTSSVYKDIWNLALEYLARHKYRRQCYLREGFYFSIIRLLSQ